MGISLRALRQLRSSLEHVCKRKPRCVEWQPEEVRGLVPEDKFARTIEIIGKITYAELMRFRIGLDGISNRVPNQGDCAVALVRQEHILAAQTQQVAACNALHELEERLSRWLLQSRDLLMSDTLPLTQEFLAQMLGVQRSSVTLVARRLQEAGLIGRIHVLDVEGLQESCCECYQAVNEHFRRLIGWSPNGEAAQRTAD